MEYYATKEKFFRRLSSDISLLSIECFFSPVNISVLIALINTIPRVSYFQCNIQEFVKN